MRVPRSLLVLIAGIVGFCVWYYFASNYDYGILSGVYRYHQGSLTSTLTLHADRTFEQEVKGQDFAKHTEGHWRRIGQASVVFSEQFLRLPDQVSYMDEYPRDTPTSGRFLGHFEKYLGLHPVLYLNGNPNGVTSYKALLR